MEPVKGLGNFQRLGDFEVEKLLVGNVVFNVLFKKDENFKKEDMAKAFGKMLMDIPVKDYESQLLELGVVGGEIYLLYGYIVGTEVIEAELEDKIIIIFGERAISMAQKYGLQLFGLEQTTFEFTELVKDNKVTLLFAKEVS